VVYTPIRAHHPRFVHHYLRAQPLPSIYRTISNGIRPDQWRLEPEKFRDIPVWLPPGIDEQTAIAAHIDDMASKIDAVCDKTLTSIERLQEFTAALITDAVTGQIDVATWRRHGKANPVTPVELTA